MALLPFDIDTFLVGPLTARVATNGPTVRPTWYLWEDGAFWILTGPWAKLLGRVQTDPAIAVTVDVCDISTGLVQQVIFTGPNGGPLKHSGFRRTWNKVRAAVELPDLHFHDLRHVGNTLAASNGASLKGLMSRMGTPPRGLR